MRPNKTKTLPYLYTGIFLLIVIIIYQVLHLNSDIVKKYDSASERGNKKLSLLYQIKSHADKVQIALMNHVLDSSVENMKLAGEEINRETLINDSLYKEYEKTIDNKTELALFNEMALIRKNNKDIRDTLQQIDYANGANIGPSIYYQQHFQQASYKKYQHYINTFSKRIQDNLKATQMELDKDYINAIMPIIICSFLLLVLLIVLAFTIYFHLRKLREKEDSVVSEKRFSEAILTAAPDGIIGINKLGEIVIFNHQAEQIFEYHSKEVIGKQLSVLLPERFKKNHAKFIEYYFDSPSNKPLNNRAVELWGMKKNGEEFPLDISLSHTSIDGEEIAIAGVRDISAKIKTLNRLKRLADINEHSSALIGIAKMDKEIIYLNNSFLRAIGLDDNYLSTGIKTKDIYPDNRQLYVADAIASAVEYGVWTGENELLTTKGELIPVLQNIVVHRDEYGVPAYTSTTIIDISDLKSKEQEVVRINKLFYALSKASQLLLNLKTKEIFYNNICEVIVEIGDLELAWVGEYNACTQYLEPKGWEGVSRDYLEGVDIRVDKDAAVQGPAARSILSGDTIVANDFLSEDSTKQWHENAKKYRIASACVLPFRIEGELKGSLIVYSSHVGFFNDKEVALLEDIANIITIGVEKIGEEKARIILENSRKQLSGIIENTKAYVSITGLDSRYIFMNESARNAFGFKQDEDITKYYAYSVFTEDEVERYKKDIYPVLESKGIWSGEVEFIGANKQIVNALLVTVLHRDESGNPAYRSSTAIDITEQKTKEKEIKKLSGIIESTEAYVSITNPDNSFSYLNSSCRKILGIGEEEDISKYYVQDFLLPEAIERYVVEILPALERNNIWHGEMEFVGKKGNIIHVLLVGILHRDAKGNALYRSSTAIDITEQKNKANELKRMTDIIESSNSYVTITEPNGKFIFINDSFRHALGIASEEMTSLYRTSDFMSMEAINHFTENCLPELERNDKWSGEISFISKNGAVVHTLMSAMIHRDNKGNILYHSSTAIDITLLKQQEKEKRRFEETIAHSTAFIGIVSLDRKLLYLNDNFRKSLCIPLSKDVKGMPISDFISPKANEAFERTKNKLLETGVWIGESELISCNGKLIPVIQVIVLHKDENGLPEFTSTTAIDISELKMLQKESSKLASIIHSSKALIGIANPDFTVNYMNKAMVEALEIDSEEDITKLSISEFLTPESSIVTFEVAVPMLLKNGIWSGEVDWKSRSGKIIPVTMVNVVHYDADGEVEYITTNAIDISEMKAKSEENKRLLEILDNSKMLVGISDKHSDIIYLNKELQSVLGYNEKTEYQIHVTNILSASSIELFNKETMPAVFSKGIWQGEAEWKKKDGTIFPVFLVCVAHKNDEGNIEYISVNGIDITEIKEKEKENKRLLEIMDHSNTIVGVANPDGTLAYCNRGMRNALGIDLKQDINVIGIHDIHPAEMVEKIKNIVIPAAMKNGFWNGEMDFLNKDGSIVHTYAIHYNHLDERGELEYISVNAIDISELKEKESELKKLASIIEYSNSFIGIAKSDNTIDYINEGLREAVGIESDMDLSTLKHTDFLSADTVNKFVSEILPSAEKDGKWQGEMEFLKKDGSIIPTYAIHMNHYDPKGVLKYTSINAIDISEIKNKENELVKLSNDLRSLYTYLQNVREEERKTIAKEIHDELGQNLTAMKLYISWLKTHPGEDKDTITDKLMEFEKITDETVNTSRRLYNNLYPQLLNDVGIVGAILWLLNSYKSSGVIDSEFNSNIDNRVALKIDANVSLVIFRIFQECITNILRYAKANLVTVNLYKNDDHILMVVEDDGIGFSIDKVDTQKHHGLLGMRERAYSLNGDLKIESIIGRGTKTIVTIPI